MAGMLAPKMQRQVAQTPLLELLDQWIENGLSSTVIPKHRAYSRNRPTRMFEECGWTFVRDISPADFEKWRNASYSGRGGVEKRSAKTLNDYLAHVRSFLKWMEEREMIARDPLRMVKKLRVVQEDANRAFTMEELQALLDAVPPYRAYLYTVAAYTGLRRSELMSLEWGHLDLDSGTPRMNLPKANTKNRRGGRLPLQKAATDALRALRETAPAGRAKVFFRGVTGMPRFPKDLKLAGIAEVDENGRRLIFHSFRYTLATMLHAAGVPPLVARALMRHETSRMTEVTYTDSNNLPLEAALAKLAEPKSCDISCGNAGKTWPEEAKGGKPSGGLVASELPQNEEVSPDLATAVHTCSNMHGEGFEPPTNWV